MTYKPPASAKWNRLDYTGQLRINQNRRAMGLTVRPMTTTKPEPVLEPEPVYA